MPGTLHSRTPGFAGTACFLGLLIVTACADTAGEASRSTGVRDASLHATMTEELGVRVNQLSVLTDDDRIPDTERQQEHLRRINAIAIAADRLRVSAMELGPLTAQLELSPADRDRFLDLGEQLESYATTMEQAARDNRSDVLPSLMANINGTCATCHALYR